MRTSRVVAGRVSSAALRAHGIPVTMVASTLAVSPRSVLRAAQRAKPSSVLARG